MTFSLSLGMQRKNSLRIWQPSWTMHCLHPLQSVVMPKTTSKLIVGYAMPSIFQLVSEFTLCLYYQLLFLTQWSLNLDRSSCFSDPPDDELGAHSGCATDYTCENPSCSRAFHSVCLRDWLRSITSTRQYV